MTKQVREWRKEENECVRQRVNIEVMIQQCDEPKLILLSFKTKKKLHQCLVAKD